MDVGGQLQKRSAEIERDLVSRFGGVLTLSDLVVVLRYPSTQAAQKALVRVRLPVDVRRMPMRRQWFAPARKVAEVLAGMEIEETAAMS